MFQVYAVRRESSLGENVPSRYVNVGPVANALRLHTSKGFGRGTRGNHGDQA